MVVHPDSVRSYREMLELDPGSRVFELLAEQLYSAGDWAETADVCRRGLVFHPGRMRARILLGLALKELGDRDESERVLAGVAEEIRESGVVFSVLSEFAAAAGDAERAGELQRVSEALGGRIEPGWQRALMPADMEKLLSGLAERIERRSAEAAVLPSLLSDAHRELLTRVILSEISSRA